MGETDGATWEVSTDGVIIPEFDSDRGGGECEKFAWPAITNWGGITEVKRVEMSWPSAENTENRPASIHKYLLLTGDTLKHSDSPLSKDTEGIHEDDDEEEEEFDELEDKDREELEELELEEGCFILGFRLTFPNSIMSRNDSCTS